MTTENKTVAELRDEGHLVVVFSPEEMKGVEDYSLVEDALIQRAWDVIESAKGGN